MIVGTGGEYRPPFFSQPSPAQPNQARGLRGCTIRGCHLPFRRSSVSRTSVEAPYSIRRRVVACQRSIIPTVLPPFSSFSFSFHFFPTWISPPSPRIYCKARLADNGHGGGWKGAWKKKAVLDVWRPLKRQCTSRHKFSWTVSSMRRRHMSGIHETHPVEWAASPLTRSKSPFIGWVCGQ